MKYEVLTTRHFDKALKKCIKRGRDMSKFKDCLDLLAKEGKLPPKYKAHKLSGTHTGAWECHLEADWLLIWEQNDSILTLLMVDIGTHSDIF